MRQGQCQQRWDLKVAVEPSPCSGEDRAFSAPQKCPVSSESVYSHTEHSRAPPCTPTPQVPQHSALGRLLAGG